MTDGTLDIPSIQGLCDRFAEEFRRMVSMMGQGDVIRASSARERLGTTHAMASRIMAKEMDEVPAST